MIEARYILRQVKDIQVQADRLIKGQADLTEIESFAKYSYELRTYLTRNIKDDLILKYLNEIPILDLDSENEGADGLFESLLYFFGGLFGTYSLEHKKQAEALDLIRDIKGKYASAEFLLRNYFE